MRVQSPGCRYIKQTLNYYEKYLAFIQNSPSEKPYIIICLKSFSETITKGLYYTYHALFSEIDSDCRNEPRVKMTVCVLI